MGKLIDMVMAKETITTMSRDDLVTGEIIVAGNLIKINVNHQDAIMIIDALTVGDGTMDIIIVGRGLVNVESWGPTPHLTTNRAANIIQITSSIRDMQSMN